MPINYLANISLFFKFTILSFLQYFRNGKENANNMPELFRLIGQVPY